MADKQELVCDGCQKTLRIPEKYWGKKVRCPQCSHVLSIPATPPSDLDEVELIEDDDPYADDPYTDLPPAPVAAPPRQRKSARRSRPKKSRKAARDDGGAFGLEKRMLSAGVLGGMGLIAVAVIWFVVGLMGGIIFYYPPVMIIIGLVSIVKGLLGSE